MHIHPGIFYMYKFVTFLVSWYSRGNHIEVLFMFYECNDRRNNREVMSSDHHVIGSRFADDVNVINVTATDIHPQSIRSKLPISSQFQRVKYVFGRVFRNENHDGGYWLFRVQTINDEAMLSMFDQHRQGKLNLNFQSEIPPRIFLLCCPEGGLWGWYRAHVKSIQLRTPMVRNGMPWYGNDWYGMV